MTIAYINVFRFFIQMLKCGIHVLCEIPFHFLVESLITPPPRPIIEGYVFLT